MRKAIVVTACVALVLALAFPALAGPKGGKKGDCRTIQSGEIYDAVNNEQILPGYDEYGYNYQAHMFNGRYCDADRVLGGEDECCDTHLIMKWNDAWLSNMDCDGDGLLDRPDDYIGSGAWLTNHISGECDLENLDGVLFVKIVALPEGAACDVPSEACDAYSGYMCYTDDEEIGCQIWGAFAIIQEVWSGEGATYISPAAPGLGNW